MGVSRFSVSADKSLLNQFDAFVRQEGYPTRSEAVQALIRQALVRKEWADNDEVVGAITLVYDHHQRNLSGKLTALQHKFEGLVVCVQHVHVDHHNCLEALIVRGRSSEIQNFVKALKSLKHLKHSGMVTTTTGQSL